MENIIFKFKQEQKEKLYFAHSMKIYRTKKEKEFLKAIKINFKNYKIVNPAIDVEPGIGVDVMKPFFKEIENCSIIVVHEYDGFVGRGVFFEILQAMANKIPTYVIRENSNNYEFSLVEDLEIFDATDWKEKYGKVNSAGKLLLK